MHRRRHSAAPETEREQVHRAVQSRRILVATRTLGGYDIPGPLQQALISAGVTNSAMHVRGVGLDRASQQLFADAVGQLPPAPDRPSTATPDKTAAIAALRNHAPQARPRLSLPTL